MAEAAPASSRLRVDLHSHTRHSFDCLSDPDEILRVASACGIDRLAITDHNQIGTALALHAAAPGRIIVGEEVKTREGFDVIGLFIRELIPKRTPARETCERIRAQGGVVYIPHPFDVARSGAGDKHLDALADLIDVVEVHNSRCLTESVNARARSWADARGKLHGAGSDAHTLAEIGSGYVVMPAFECSRESFLAALADGTVAGCSRSSPLYRLVSTYAKLRKRLPLPG
ncbi:MAG: PHP domain-containing protein [Gemmatimonadetes bacterium]|nr:PHP domain-containing protein [Gemmatimonadota bacterium]